MGSSPSFFEGGSKSQSELPGFVTTYPHGFTPCLNNPVPRSLTWVLASTEILWLFEWWSCSFHYSSQHMTFIVHDGQWDSWGELDSVLPLPHCHTSTGTHVCWMSRWINFVSNSTSLKALNYYIDFIGLSKHSHMGSGLKYELKLKMKWIKRIDINLWIVKQAIE